MRISNLFILLSVLAATVTALHEKQSDRISAGKLSAACQLRQTNDGSPGNTECLTWDGSPIKYGPHPFPCGCLDDDQAGAGFPGTGDKEKANTEETNFVEYSIGKNAPDTYQSLSGFAFTDNTREIFVVAKAGYIFHVDMNTEAITMFMDLSTQVHNVGDYGMLSIATNPDFKNNPYVYASYVNASIVGDNSNFNTITFTRVLRIKSQNGKPVSSTYILGRDPQDSNPLCSSSHAGGALAFGHDGSLFITLGEGSHFDTDYMDFGQTQKRYPLSGYCNAVFPGQAVGAIKAQWKDSLGGKLIRVDPGTGDGICPGSTPSFGGSWSVYNPYCDGSSLRAPRSRIYAMGFRNPFSMNVRPYRDGDTACGVPYVGDVGLGSYEEINAVTRPGLNFGWPCWEGPQPMAGYRDSTLNDLTSPLNNDLLRPQNDAGQNFSCPYVYDNVETTQPTYYWSRYTHDMGGLYGEQYNLETGWTGNCVSGVNFYTGSSYPAQFQDQVFFSDYGSQWIKSMTVTKDDVLQTQYAFQSLSVAIVDLEINPDNGDLCYLELLAGIIHCQGYAAGAQPPVVNAGSDVTAGATPLSVRFNVDGTYQRDYSAIEYIAWTFGDGSAPVFDPNPKHTYTKAGVFTARVFVSNGEFTVNKSVTITVGRIPPAVSITQPAAGSRNSFGTFYTYNASENAALQFHGLSFATGKVTYFWDIYMVHTNHYHPESFVQVGQSFSADTDSMGASSHVGERINFLAILTATDSFGLTGTSYVRLQADDWESNHPVAKFVVYPSNTAAAGQPLRFDASASYDIDLDTVNYLWDFGDGMTINFSPLTINKFVSHSYTKPGTYTVRLTTFDNWGTSNSTTQMININSGGYVLSPPSGVSIPSDDTPVGSLPTVSPSDIPQTTQTQTPTQNKDGKSGDASMATASVFVVLVSVLMLVIQ